MPRKLKILMLIKPFGKKYPKYKEKFELFKTVERFAKIRYWYDDGDIREILKQVKFKPDFIFHYDISWNYRYAPKITELDKINIPKACFVIDTHFSPKTRRKYIEKNKIDLIFSVTKNPFLTQFPEYREKFRWLPFSINSKVFKDWGLKKKTRYLLMGQFYCEGVKNPPKRIPPKGRYPFREKVFKKMRKKKAKGFVFHPHPGHYNRRSNKMIVNKNYAQELNRAAIFFTCGGKFEYPVLKFFEAPACKTLLLAEPNPDILELGFKDAVHFVACTSSNFYKKAKYYHKNEKERNRIAKNGYKFVHKNHTHKIRAKQFVTYIEDFLKSRS